MADDLIKSTHEWWADRANLMYKHGVEKGEDNIRRAVALSVMEYDTGLIDLHQLLVDLRSFENG